MSGERDFSTRRRPRGRQAGEVALLAVSGLLLAASAYAALSAFKDSRDARESYEAVQQEIAAANARIKDLQPGAGDESGVGARAVWSAEAPPPRVVGAIAEMLPPEVRLETLTLHYGAQLEVEMTLTARTATDYDRFLRSLEASPEFDRVVLGEETRIEVVRASVRARYRSGAES